ncbi:MAG: helix-turn-helix transcriptional regulator [Planctomycetaceae bacterium]|nr:helix-turn-helix transcriptional regulator [Planctomycetaceae bacterium]
MPEDLDPVFKALADPTRRAILDALRTGPQNTGSLVEQFPNLSRFAVMKHIDVLREANLIVTQAQGRQRIHSLNAVPLRQMYERWVSPFQELWASQLTELQRRFDQPPTNRPKGT